MAYYQPLQKHGSKLYFFCNTICGYDYISLKAVNMRAQIIIEYVDHRLNILIYAFAIYSVLSYVAKKEKRLNKYERSV